MCQVLREDNNPCLLELLPTERPRGPDSRSPCDDILKIAGFVGADEDRMSTPVRGCRVGPDAGICLRLLRNFEINTPEDAAEQCDCCGELLIGVDVDFREPERFHPADTGGGDGVEHRLHLDPAVLLLRVVGGEGGVESGVTGAAVEVVHVVLRRGGHGSGESGGEETAEVRYCGGAAVTPLVVPVCVVAGYAEMIGGDRMVRDASGEVGAEGEGPAWDGRA